MAKNNRLTKAEKQEVLNTVVEGLVKQGRTSTVTTVVGVGLSTGRKCVYRYVPDEVEAPATSCAVGQLIPPDAYQSWMDGQQGSLLEVLKGIDRSKLSSLSKKAFSVTNERFLADLQQMHDTINYDLIGKRFVAALRKSCRLEVTEYHRLEMPPSLAESLL